MSEIAAAVGVNRGLLHRHFGSKDDLLAAVFRAASDEGATLVEDSDSVFDALRELNARGQSQGFSEMLAWALLSGSDPQQFLGTSSAIPLLVERAAELRDTLGVDPESARYDVTVVVAATVSIGLGWRLYESFLVPASELTDQPIEEIRATVEELADIFLVTALSATNDDGPEERHGSPEPRSTGRERP